MSKVLVIAGYKEGGKSSAAKFLTGYFMQQAGRLKLFDVNDKGELITNTRFTNAQGVEEEGQGILDIYRRDYEFIRYAISNIWPHVKVYSFADRLKQTLEIVFGVPHELLTGTNEQKNTILPHILWENMPGYKGKETGPMTARQLAQYFGSEVCRAIYDDCWIEACATDIMNDDPPIAIIDDARFPNEVRYMQKSGAKAIKLCRKPHSGDSHQSETALDKMDEGEFDAVIHNENMTMQEKNEAVLAEVLRFGFVEAQV